MKRLIVSVLVLLALVCSTLQVSANELSWSGFTLLPKLLTVGGDISMNIKTYEIGAGVSKSLLTYESNLFGIPHTVTLMWVPIAHFSNYDVTALGLDWNFSNSNSALRFLYEITTLSFGVQYGKKTGAGDLMSGEDVWLAHINLPLDLGKF